MPATQPPPQVQNVAAARPDPRHHDLAYSVRRYYVDEFFFRRVAELAPGSRVIDIGGMKGRKRGQFDISRYDLRVTTVNTSEAAKPDILADACAIPLPDGSADAAILGEVIEHLPNPQAALAEAARLLRPGGVLLATAPFLFRVHEDPIDVGRYTPQWWERSLGAAGFAEITVERQGLLLSVLAELLRGWGKHAAEVGGDGGQFEFLAPEKIRAVRERAMALEQEAEFAGDEYYQSFTTGYGVRAVRA